MFNLFDEVPLFAASSCPGTSRSQTPLDDSFCFEVSRCPFTTDKLKMRSKKMSSLSSARTGEKKKLPCQRRAKINYLLKVGEKKKLLGQV